MAINLTKGQTINLEKDQYDLSNVTIGLGWDVAQKEKGFWSSLFSSEEGDDEQLVVKLNNIGSEYSKIVFLVSIYQGKRKGQNFGQISNAFIKAVDAKSKEMLRYDLSHDQSFDGKCAMIFGELYRHKGAWKFQAIGTPYATDNFVEILKNSYL